ncbi:DUF2141 domain-containing protein [Persicobacter psychrovividus]|uniref:DUF2141 domain-containing protein n=1 Tax=Persicobacter psychrovividus TaxID=387638 RepID=A0ABM7VEH0_9BACT|nr:hypothetical protein PEPS_16340 [Persicobacter psychrovividus]
MRLTLLLICITLFANLAHGQNQLNIDISGLRNQTGTLNVLIYDNGNGFPDDIQLAVKKIIVDASSPTIRIDDLSFGQYAIAILHDENKDLAMNFNWLGLPKEGFGFSNNKPILAGPPNFDAAAITFKQHQQNVNIKLKYL